MKNIAIIGAGISGLFLANLLEKDNSYSYKIFEKKTSIDINDGYGIQLSVNSINLLKCHFMEFNNQAKFKDDTNLDCVNYEEKEIFKEVSKRVLNPFYMIIVSLISSLLILKSKEESNISQSKIILFAVGIFFLIFGEIMLSISNSINEYKNFFFVYPIIIIFIIYFYIKLKLKFT